MDRLFALVLLLLGAALALWLGQSVADGATATELAPEAEPSAGGPPIRREAVSLEAVTPRAPRGGPVQVIAPEPALEVERIEATEAPGWLPDDRAWYGECSGPEIVVYHESGEPAYKAEQVRLATGEWVREGDWLAWYENGQLNELGAYKGDAEHGPWDWYYENGQAQASGSWNEGKRLGPWVFWYENGQKMMDGSYHGGNGTGEWTHYHENGVLRAQGTMLDGEIDGYWTFWNDDGTVEQDRTGTYQGGALID